MYTVEEMLNSYEEEKSIRYHPVQHEQITITLDSEQCAYLLDAVEKYRKSGSKNSLDANDKKILKTIIKDVEKAMFPKRSF